MHIVIICGTNRTGALSRKLATETAAIYTAAGHEADLIDMADLPASIIDGAAYKNHDAALKGLVERFCAADGVHFIVPEYNGSFPGILKLFIDMLPYPEGFDNRPCAFIGLAAGQYKGLRAVEHLQQVAGYRNAVQFPRRLFIGDSYKQFGDDDRLADQELAGRLAQQCTGFADFIAALKH